LPLFRFPAARRATAGTGVSSCDRRGQRGNDTGTNRDDEERIDGSRCKEPHCTIFGPDHFHLSFVTFSIDQSVVFCYPDDHFAVRGFIDKHKKRATQAKNIVFRYEFFERR
jgi:hypothetical protein